MSAEAEVFGPEEYVKASFAAEGLPDPRAKPAAYRGVVSARVWAFLFDLLYLGLILFGAAIVFGILGLLSFGLLWPSFGVLAPVIALTYFTVSLGGPHSATPGMRRQRIVMRTWDGRAPGYVQAACQTVLFYVTVSILTVLVLLVPFFNAKKRCLHDFLCGSVFLNREHAG